jgi:methionyl-tRNA formyltransferase
LRIVFMGTGEFAIPSLRAIDASSHSLVGLVTQPDRPKGRGAASFPTPNKDSCRRAWLPGFSARENQG